MSEVTARAKPNLNYPHTTFEVHVKDETMEALREWAKVHKLPETLTDADIVAAKIAYIHNEER